MERQKISLAVAVPMAIFYVFIVIFSILGLAEAQIRSSFGLRFDTWRLNMEANMLSNTNIKKDIDQETTNIASFESSMRFDKMCIELFDENGTPNNNAFDQETLKQIDLAKQNKTDVKDLKGNVYCGVLGRNQAKSDAEYFQGQYNRAQTKLESDSKSLGENEKKHEELSDGHEEFMALMQMEKSWIQRPFIIAPYDLLILLLVMSMGALGGIVRLLRDYGAADHANPTIGEYFLIPLIGAVVAIGGYVLAKTGLLLLSSAGEENYLSPFMISLVGIVSGLLAKEVIDTIAARGRKLLSGGENTKLLGVSKRIGVETPDP